MCPRGRTAIPGQFRQPRPGGIARGPWRYAGPSDRPVPKNPRTTGTTRRWRWSRGRRTGRVDTSRATARSRFDGFFFCAKRWPESAAPAGSRGIRRIDAERRWTCRMPVRPASSPPGGRRAHSSSGACRSTAGLLPNLNARISRRRRRDGPGRAPRWGLALHKVSGRGTEADIPEVRGETWGELARARLGGNPERRAGRELHRLGSPAPCPSTRKAPASRPSAAHRHPGRWRPVLSTVVHQQQPFALQGGARARAAHEKKRRAPASLRPGDAPGIGPGLAVAPDSG